ARIGRKAYRWPKQQRDIWDKCPNPSLRNDKSKDLNPESAKRKKICPSPSPRASEDKKYGKTQTGWFIRTEKAETFEKLSQPKGEENLGRAMNFDERTRRTRTGR
ncbi:hypothetical protein KI387_038375, partial [Taxus chinensis]